MDKIRIDGLEIFANHGCLDAEKQLGQKFIISADIYLDSRAAGCSDDLHKTVNYAEVCAGITQLLTEQTYQLIETCAEKAASYILHNYPPARSVSVNIEKPWAPIGQSVRTVSVQVSRRWSKVYLGLGSNLGDTKALLDGAINMLGCDEVKVLRQSSYYKTQPVSEIPQDSYLNSVLEAETTLSARELMAHLLHIESLLGRERTVRHGPRTIDIDILTYDDVVSDEEEVLLPHPRMHERLFVLVPFCELNPYFVHPLLNQRIIDLKSQLEKTQTL